VTRPARLKPATDFPDRRCHAVFHPKPAIAGHVILAADDRHFIFLAERRNVDDQPLDQDLLVVPAFFQNDSPAPFSARVSAAMVL